MSNIITAANLIDESTLKALRLDASNARQEGRLDVSTAAFWDQIVSTFGTGAKGNDVTRSDIIAGVLTDIGEWSEGPQKKDGVRTAFGNVVQRFGARFDAAVKRADDTVRPSVLRVSLSGEGGGSTVVPADHPLYESLVALLASE